MGVERVAHGVGRPSPSRSTCATWPSAWTPASVRPAPDSDALAGKPSIASARRALHRGAVVLALPADERRAVIFEGEPVAGHGGSAQRPPARQRRCRAGTRRRSSAACPARCSSRSRTAPSPQATGQLVVEHACPGAPVAGRPGRAQNLDPLGLPAISRTSAGKRRQAADLIVHLDRAACDQSMRASSLAIFLA